MHKVLTSNHDQVLLFISNTSCDETAEDLYRVTDYLEAVRANVKVYPKKSEWSWSLPKVGDIRTLDDVARESNTWRPKTCFGRGECLLTQPHGGQMVLKRSYSCAGRDVQVVAMTNRGKLLCKAPEPDQAPKHPKRGRYQGVQAYRFLYFHQEYVSTFRRTGEFRIWVCDGRVVCAFRTKDDEHLPGKPMALRQLDIDYCKHRSCMISRHHGRICEMKAGPRQRQSPSIAPAPLSLQSRSCPGSRIRNSERTPFSS